MSHFSSETPRRASTGAVGTTILLPRRSEAIVPDRTAAYAVPLATPNSSASCETVIVGSVLGSGSSTRRAFLVRIVRDALLSFNVSPKDVVLTSGFRITAWPGQPVDAPPIPRFDVSVVDDDVMEYRSAEREPAVMPEEFFLRELQRLDETNQEDLRSFEQDWGPLAHLGGNPMAFLPTAKYPVSKPYVPYEQLVSQLDRPSTAGVKFVPIPVIRVHVQILKAIANHWLLHARGELDREWASAWESAPVHAPSLENAWKIFFTHLDHGLQHFSLRVWSPDIDWVQPSHNLYMGTCLQVYNHIAKRATYRVCANETCGQAFHHQRGRSRSGQLRSRNVKYCSSNCGKAQAQREYRRRQADSERAGGS